MQTGLRSFIRSAFGGLRTRRGLKFGLGAWGVLASFAIGGCDSLPSGDRGGDTEAISKQSGALVAAPRQIYRKENPGVAAAPLVFGLVQYFGGRVVSNIQVVEVVYGAGGSGAYIPEITGSTAPNVPSFYQGVLNSPHVDWLVEYNTTAPLPLPRTDQVIGRGSFSRRVTITPSAANNGSVIDDDNIRAELSAQIASGVLPAPTHDAAGNNNTYYAVFFPHGKVITTVGITSCVDFCAYHGEIANAGGKGEIYYGVHPDLQVGSGCDVGCGNAPTLFDKATMIASHELVETMTDPGPFTGWFNGDTGEEIADLCLGQSGTIVGSDGVTYRVQNEWSNLAFFCIISKSGGGTGGSGGGGAGGAGGRAGTGGAGTGGAGTGGAGTGGAGTGGAGTGGRVGTGGAGTGGAGTGGRVGTGGAGTGGRVGTGGASTGGRVGTGGAGTGGRVGTGGAGTGGRVGTGGAGTGGRVGTGGAGTGGRAGTGGAGGSGPCAGLCANPTNFTVNGSFQSGSIGTGNVCAQTTSVLHAGTCGNFVSPRQLTVNGTTRPCDMGNWTSVPPARNGGYCIQTTSGNQPWAFFTVW